ncbi:MAG: HepT-like ribonuclease domain-containing protein [Sulfuricellaceae bacterium]
MAHDPCAYLWDAREACDAIREFVAGVDLHTYMETPLLHSAVERKFEIIGEALNQLSKVDPILAAHIPDLARIVAFRNMLIHGYAAVDHPRVWRVVQESLPELHTVVARLLDESGQN